MNTQKFSSKSKFPELPFRFILLILVMIPIELKAQNSGFGEPVYLGKNEVSDITRIKAIDINRDANNYEDLAVIGKHQVGWFENPEASWFGGYQQIISTDAPINTVDIGDLDNDGAPDIAWFVQGNDKTLYVGFNDGTGSFEEFSEYELEEGISRSTQLTIINIETEGGKILIKSLFDLTNGALREMWFNQEGELMVRNVLENHYDAYMFDTAHFNPDEEIDIVFLNSQGSIFLTVYLSETESNYNRFDLEQDFWKRNQYSADFLITDTDDDGYLDVIHASKSSQPQHNEHGYGYLNWYENHGDTAFSEIQVIDSLKLGYDEIHEFDVDMDGLKDIVAVFNTTNRYQPYDEQPSRIFWYRKKAGGMYEERQVLADPLYPYNTIDFMDINTQGNKDMVGLSYSQLSWMAHANTADFIAPEVIAESSVGHISNIVAADLNNDGLPDLAAGSIVKGKGVSWLKNEGNFSFSEPVIIDDEIANVQEIKVLDVEGDRFEDILALSSHFYREAEGFTKTTYRNYKLVFYKNVGGYFNEGQVLIESPYSPDIGVEIQSFTLGDFDGDGDLDISLHAIDKMLWFENESDLNFSSPKTAAGLDISIAIALEGTFSEDVNMDGKDELITSYTKEMVIDPGSPFQEIYNVPVLEIYAFSSDSGFYPYYEYQFQSTNYPYYSLSGDLNEDGNFDLVFAGTSIPTSTQPSAEYFQITWLSQTENDTVWSERIINSEQLQVGFTGVAAADIDGDSDLDFVASKLLREIVTNNSFQNFSDGTILWYKNTGDSLFAKQALIDTLRPSIHNVLTADFNNDGFPDVLAGIGGEKKIAIYPNQLMGVNTEYPGAETPSVFSLAQNYPNPFNPTTMISFNLPVNSEVRLEVFDLLGRKVATLVDERMQAGSHEIQFNAQNLSSGVYFYQLKTELTSLTKKMLLLK
ncbi:MAG: T9SS type A sorting domain-containing protein [Balneolaceae bacterium]